MRIRALLILATTLLGVMALSGAALAATKTCSANPCVGTNGPDRLKGTDAKNEIRALGGPDYIAGKPRADELYGGRGQDEVRAGNGRDRVFGGRGEDQLYGGGGNDTMNAQDGYKDNVNCGLGTDTAYVDKRDRVNEDCEDVFVSGAPGPDPVVDKVSGRGELGSAYGNPRLRVEAESARTNPDDAQGTFSITYPGNPDVARDNTYVRGTIRCLAVTGKEARLVGQIGSASGPRADNGTFQKGEYVRIGVLDNATNDKANFSAGEQTFTSCNGETPNLDVLEGNFVVEEDV
jgi:Ca2+-binding RTX toxin-like protein